MSSSIQYNPNPPRVWSRVQRPCSFNVNQNGNFAIADLERQMLLKGNILQYKKNSSSLTKKQRYTQIAKGMWTNRTKTWATQSDKYTNPNTTSLLRINSNVLDPSNNTFSNPPNPFGCPTTTIQDGGNLVCNTVVNPCTQEIIKRTESQQLCNPTTDSDVPGQIQQLCWNNGTQTWYPRQIYIMPTSGTKWPEGYKGFVSAITFVGPILSIENMICGQIDIPLSWTFLNSTCLPITSFNIYQNGVLIQTVPVSQTSITITEIVGSYSFYVTSVSNNIESEKSNIVNVNTQYGIVIDGLPSYTISSGIVTITFTKNSSITFNCSISNIYILCIGGGGGGGGSGNNYGSGGGSGGIGVVSILPITAGDILNITIGTKGYGAKDEFKGNPGTNSSVYKGSNNIITSTGGGGGNTTGGSAGTSTSDIAVTSYNGGKGGKYNTENGYSLSTPIIMITTFYYGGGGGGGGTAGGGKSGNLGVGGIKNYLQPNFNGEAAKETSYGSGGGGGGNKSGDYYNGGNGANGVVIIQFNYP